MVEAVYVAVKAGVLLPLWQKDLVGSINAWVLPISLPPLLVPAPTTFACDARQRLSSFVWTLTLPLVVGGDANNGKEK